MIKDILICNDGAVLWLLNMSVIFSTTPDVIVNFLGSLMFLFHFIIQQCVSLDLRHPG